MKVILRNALKDGRLSVAAAKVLKRLEPDTRAEAATWARERAIEIEDYCRAQDAALWAETQQVCARIRMEGEAILQSLPVKLGGGGAYPLLYFLARRHRPRVMLETGVAAGWSSRALLEAARANGGGALFSSDFPYLRMADPERYIGCLVPEELRASWRLDIRGDRRALPDLLARAGSIDFFHYDSDKSASGRRFALSLIKPRLSPRAVLIMDDIDDNTFFRRFTESTGLPSRVFAFAGKHLGATGID
jgi:predicted O-methyltransferase YrrM